MLAALGCGPAQADNPDWMLFKQRFISPEGRVIDSGQGGISHSEGQGVAMLLATAQRDRTTFAGLWEWTRSHLQIRQDRLLAWRWVPGAGADDLNNATDGDLFVAWALLRAHDQWPEAGYRESAMAILEDVRHYLIHRDPRGPLLLPGREGFSKPEGVTVNLSYWLFPAFSEFDRALPDPLWRELGETGINVLLEAHFGRWGLPPDWLALGEKLAPAPDRPPRFGYDAVRIPLYLLWAGQTRPELLDPFRRYWRHFEGAHFLPAWTRLDDDSVDSHDAAPGIRAVAKLTFAAPGLHNTRLPPLDTTQDYFSASLLLLSGMMRNEK